MKNLMTLSIALMLILNLHAQNEEYQHVITANAGASIFGAIFNALDGNPLNSGDTTTDIEGIDNLNGLFEANTTPALQASYDYGVTNWFSVGGSVAFQNFNADITDLSYTRESDGQQVNAAAATIGIRRVSVGIRALFHYGNTDKIDMYSGLRLGVSNWGIKAESSSDTFSEDLQNTRFSGAFPAVQVIPFALRGYVTENIGLNFETGLGTPHYFAIGVNYRL